MGVTAGALARSVFDYIVVGAGSAGCVLAHRLSADGRSRVLLIEAGGNDADPVLHIPLGFGQAMRDPRYTWGFVSEPDVAGRRLDQPRGRVLGGSSAINGLLYIRGMAADYDQWRQLGCAGWGWDDVLPYFTRSEDHRAGASPAHGAGGAMAVSRPERHPVTDAFLAACAQAGVPLKDDLNAGDNEGAAYAPMTALNGSRVSTATAFLKDVRDRKNLHILTRAHVCAIVVDGDRATGVRVRDRSGEHDLRAGGEIILAAGAFGSPHILMHSGIGPPEVLRDAGVTVRVEAPGVGADLQDHYAVMVVARTQRAGTINERLSGLGIVGEGLRYAMSRRGSLASSAAQAVAFVKTDPALSYPDVQMHMLPASSSDTKALDPFPALTCAPCQLRPHSRGAVRIAGPDPLQPPRIQPNYLTAPEDQTAIVAGLRFARKILAQSALAALVRDEHLPGGATQTDDALLAYARAKGESVYHPVGTCRMGADEGAVVDDRLRVRGIERLRIADASIMPRLISGNTNAACIMIGEKASDLVLADRP